MTGAHRIEHIDVWPVDIPLDDEFVISRGSISSVESAFVMVRTGGGATGYGEIAPFAAVTGETRENSVAKARQLAVTLLGQNVDDHEGLAADLAAQAPSHPAACTGLECALVDCFARAKGIPLHHVWGDGDAPVYETDITLPILEESRIDALADGWYRRGFRVFKLKVGVDASADAERVLRLARRFEDVAFILDANQAFDVPGTLAFLGALEPLAGRIRLLEQPLPREDLDGMARLCREAVVTVAADESVCTLDDAERVIAGRAAHVINLKIMKSGLHQSARIARAARSAGLGLMVGGMIETRLAMGFSLALAHGVGGVRHFDLDTPLLMATDPIRGGFQYDGPRMLPPAGHGVDARPERLPS